MIVPTKDGKISLKVFFDGVAKINTISANEKDSIITPFYSLSSSQLKYPSFSPGYIKISTIALPDQGASTTLLYAVTQSAPRKLITPIGVKNLQPLGFDGPHDYTTLKNGILYMEKYGCRGTLWFDIDYLKDENYIAYLKALTKSPGKPGFITANLSPHYPLPMHLHWFLMNMIRYPQNWVHPQNHGVR